MRFLSHLSVWVCLLTMASVNIAQNTFMSPESYVSLIIKVREYYHAPTVFIIHHAHTHDLFGTYVTHTWTLMLSREGIVTLDIDFEQLQHTLRYVGNTVLPLFIVVIKGENAYYQFSKATHAFPMAFAEWFVIFLESPEKGAHDHCHNPIGNPLNIHFNVEMLVLCRDDPVLREWYTIDDENLEISELAIWKNDPKAPFHLLSSLSLYDRRKSLGGTILRGVYVKASPFFQLTDGKPGGFLGRVILELMEVMNFTVVMHSINAYGIITKNKGWTGAVGDILADRSDIAVSDFSMTASRMNVVDFPIPLFTSRYRLYVKQPDVLVVQWFAYFKTFSLWVWSCIISVIGLTTILVSIIYSFSDSTQAIAVMNDSFILVWGIFCQQGLPEFPRSTPLRVAYLTTFAVAIVLSAAYSAALICFLTACTRIMPFRTLDEFIQDGTFRFLVLRDSADYDIFAHSHDKLANKMRPLMMPEHMLPKIISEAFEQICKNPKLTFYTAEEKARAVYFSIPCHVTSIDVGRIESFSMILRKGSPYTDIINHNLLKFMFNGMLSRFKETAMKVQPNEGITFNPVKLTNVAPILTIFCGGALLGLVILLIEKCYFFVKREFSIET